MSSRAIIVVAAITSMMLGFWAASYIRSTDTAAVQQVRNFNGSVLSTPRKIAVPALQKDDGSEFSVEDLKNHWTLIFFGYTHCPDICPTTMNALAQTKKKSPDGFPQVIFVSVDPDRDKVEMLGEYVQYFDPSFKGVTGDKKLIEALALQMGSVYMKVPGSTSGDDQNYLMDHSSSVMAINPEAKLKAFISPPHSPENILKALEAIQQ